MHGNLVWVNVPRSNKRRWSKIIRQRCGYLRLLSLPVSTGTIFVRHLNEPAHVHSALNLLSTESQNVRPDSHRPNLWDHSLIRATILSLSRIEIIVFVDQVHTK